MFTFPFSHSLRGVGTSLCWVYVEVNLVQGKAPLAMAPSHAWTRDGGSSRGGKASSRGRGTFRGPVKRVWSRTDAEESECDAKRPPGDLDPDAPAFVPKRARISTQESIEHELKRKQAEAERLKAELEAKRRAVEEEKVRPRGTRGEKEGRTGDEEGTN